MVPVVVASRSFDRARSTGVIRHSVSSCPRLTVGTNYANDYSDGIRGTDEMRVGPFRLTASKLVSSSRVRNAAFGVILACRCGGTVSRVEDLVVAGRDRRHGDLGRMVLHRGAATVRYFGFGELFVFVYFGLWRRSAPPTSNTSRAESVWWLGVATGFMACALLEANNLRDVEGDRSSGKKTLAGE